MQMTYYIQEHADGILQENANDLFVEQEEEDDILTEHAMT